jgi:hypothetical protein
MIASGENVISEKMLIMLKIEKTAIARDRIILIILMAG